MKKIYKHTIVCVGDYKVWFVDNHIHRFNMNDSSIVINSGNDWGVGSRMVNVANVIEIFIEEVENE